MAQLTKADSLDLARRYVCPGRIEVLSRLGARSVMSERSGHYFRDLDGRELFDVHVNGGTFNLGHRHPELVATLKQAVDHYDIGNHHLPSGPRALLAEQLAQLTPGRLRYSVLTASGGEAIDVAVKTAPCAMEKSHDRYRVRLCLKSNGFGTDLDSTRRLCGIPIGK